MRIFSAFYYAFCALMLALSTTLLISLWTWLEMRVHTRYFIAGFVIIGFVYGFFINRARKSTLITTQILMFLIVFWIQKPDLIFYLIKESYMDFLTFGQTRLLFLTTLTLLNITLLFKFNR